MNQLTAEDRQYFSDPRNWQGGPMYEVRLVYPPEFPRTSIEDALMRFGGLIPWNSEPDHMPRLFKSILQIDGLQSVGFVHHYWQLSVLSSEYGLAIYPPQYQNALAMQQDQYWRHNWDSGWDLVDHSRLSKMHHALFLLISKMKLETPLLCASIGPEFWGHVEQRDCGQTICISRNLAVILNLPAVSVDKLSYFVSIDM